MSQSQCSNCKGEFPETELSQVTDSKKLNPRPHCRECLQKTVTLYDCGGLFPFWIDSEPVEQWIRRNCPSWR